MADNRESDQSMNSPDISAVPSMAKAAIAAPGLLRSVLLLPSRTTEDLLFWLEQFPLLMQLSEFAKLGGVHGA
jgi:hypothetical protein